MPKLLLKTALILTFIVVLVAGCSGQQKSSQEVPKEPEKPAATAPAGITAPSSQKPETKIAVRIASHMPVDFITSQGMYNAFKPLVEKNSGGTIDVQIFPAGQLFIDKDLNQAVISGSVEMGWNTSSWWSAFDQAANFPNLPFVFASQDEALRLMRGDVGKEFAKIPEENGAVFVNYLHQGIIDALITKTGPIKTPDDIKGMKVRAYNDLHNRWLKFLGASPVTMSSSEVYMALQRGTIEGAFTSNESGVTRKWYEVVKNMTRVPGGIESQILVANKSWFNSLSPEQQKIIMDGGKAAEEWTAENIKKSYQDMQNKAREMGAIVYDPTPEEMAKWKELSRPVHDYYLQSAGTKGKRLLELSSASQK